MRFPSRDLISRTVFVLSLTVLSVVYGVLAQHLGLFPSDLLGRAWQQAQTASVDRGEIPRVRYLQPRVYERDGVRTPEPGRAGAGSTLLLSLWEEADWRPGLRLIDRNGQILHAWYLQPEQIFPDPPERRTRRDPRRTNIHGSYLFPNGDVMVNLSYVGVVRLDACGRLLWRLAAGNHHSITRDEDGTFWITGGRWHDLGDSTRSGDSALSGLPRRVYRDRILHVTEDGEVLSEMDVLDVLYANNLARFIPKGSAYPPDDKMRDVTHLNDVEALPASLADEYELFEAGDLLVSLHHLDLVLVLDPDSESVTWYESGPFIQQHDPDWLGGGWIGVFDNNRDGTDRGRMLGGSRIVALQPRTDSMKVLFPTQQSDPFYTEVQGEWQQLENGNLLLTESQAGRVVEVAPDGRTVWEWTAEAYDDARVPEVSDAIRYDLAAEQVRSWPCSEPRSKG